MRKSDEVIDEMLNFSVNIIDFLKDKNIPPSVKDQLIRSSTSIGANFSEAQDASSKKDFVAKITIAKKEANETKYWLRLIEKLGYKNELLLDRNQKFLMTLQKIVSSSLNGGKENG